MLSHLSNIFTLAKYSYTGKMVLQLSNTLTLNTLNTHILSIVQYSYTGQLLLHWSNTLTLVQYSYIDANIFTIF